MLAYEIRKATKSGVLKISDGEIKLRSLTLGTLTQEEAEFMYELGSDIYIFSLFQMSEFDRQRKKCHRLFRATNPKRTVSMNQKVDKFFRPRVVELIFSEAYPIFPNDVDFTDYVQASTAKVGKIGESAFYLDECGVGELMRYCVNRIAERVERSDTLTYGQFTDMINSLKGLKKTIDADKLKLFGVELDEEITTED